MWKIYMLRCFLSFKLFQMLVYTLKDYFCKTAIFTVQCSAHLIIYINICSIFEGTTVIISKTFNNRFYNSKGGWVSLIPYHMYIKHENNVTYTVTIKIWMTIYMYMLVKKSNFFIIRFCSFSSKYSRQYFCSSVGFRLGRQIIYIVLNKAMTTN